MSEPIPPAFVPAASRDKWRTVAEEFGPAEADLQAIEVDPMVRFEFETDEMYRYFRTQGLTEPQALEALERDEKLWTLIGNLVHCETDTVDGLQKLAALLRRSVRFILKRS